MSTAPDDRPDFAELDRLRLEAVALTRRLSAASDVDARHDGFDSSRTVRITLDGHARVVDVEVGRAWRNALGVGRLGPAMVEAATEAQQHSLEEWSRAVEAQPDTPPDDRARGDLASPPPLMPSRTPDSATALEAMHELFYLAMDVTAKLTELSRTPGTPAVPQSVEGHSAGGRVTATIQAGQLSRIDFDPAWLSTASPDAIAEHTKVACAAAHASSQSAPPLQSRSFDELREVTKDPLELLRRFGLDPGRQT